MGLGVWDRWTGASVNHAFLVDLRPWTTLRRGTLSRSAKCSDEIDFWSQLEFAFQRVSSSSYVTLSQTMPRRSYEAHRAARLTPGRRPSVIE